MYNGTVNNVRNANLKSDTLSPTLFNIFSNDLAAHLNHLKLALKIGYTFIYSFIYRLFGFIAESEDKLPKMLNHL